MYIKTDKLLGKNIADNIRESGFDKHLGISEVELKTLEGGNLPLPVAAKLFEFVHLVIENKDKLPPELKRDVEEKIKPLTEKKIKPIFDTLRAIKTYKDVAPLIKSMTEALKEGRISQQDADKFAAVIADKINRENPEFKNTIADIIKAGKKPNRGGRGRDNA